MHRFWACSSRLQADAHVQVEVASHTVEDTYVNERVPSGFEFWSVRVHVTQLQTVFLYRFLQEVLGYISLTLALRPPLLQSRAGAAVSDRASAAATAALQAELQRGMGTVLQLDVSMEAPVIIMPRNSESPDKVRVAVVTLCHPGCLSLYSPATTAMLYNEECAAVTFVDAHKSQTLH